MESLIAGFILPLYCPKWILKQPLPTLDFHTFLSYICRFFLHLQICSDVFWLRFLSKQYLLIKALRLSHWRGSEN